MEEVKLERSSRIMLCIFRFADLWREGVNKYVGSWASVSTKMSQLCGRKMWTWVKARMITP